VHLDRLAEEPTEMEEGDRILPIPIGIERIVHLEADLAMGIVVDLLDNGRCGTIRLSIGLFRRVLGPLDQRGMRKWLGGTKVQRRGAGGRRPRPC